MFTAINADLLDVGGGAAAAEVAEGEADVAHEGGDEAVVGGHDAEPLAQRLAEVGGGVAFTEVVDYGAGQSDVVAGVLQADYGPFVVGGIAISKVVEGCYAAKHCHGLVAHDHAVGETLACELLGGLEVARAEGAAFGVDELGLPVDYAGIVVGHDGVGISPEGVG